MKTKLFLAIALMTTLASCSSDPSTSTGSSTTPDTSVTASSDSNQADFSGNLASSALNAPSIFQIPKVSPYTVVISKMWITMPPPVMDMNFSSLN